MRGSSVPGHSRASWQQLALGGLRLLHAHDGSHLGCIGLQHCLLRLGLSEHLLARAGGHSCSRHADASNTGWSHHTLLLHWQLHARLLGYQLQHHTPGALLRGCNACSWHLLLEHLLLQLWTSGQGLGLQHDRALLLLHHDWLHPWQWLLLAGYDDLLWLLHHH
jgi:hypothetical protein